MIRYYKLINLLLAIGLSGCATVTRGTSDQVQIQSNPVGANVTLSTGQTCVTPCTLTMGRKDEFTVHYEKPGYASQDVAVKTQIAPGGAAGFAGNMVVGGVGLVGMGADAWSGATLEHVPNPVTVDLAPLAGPSVERGRKRKSGNSDKGS
jgi:hypothetical protein